MHVQPRRLVLGLAALLLAGACSGGDTASAPSSAAPSTTAVPTSTTEPTVTSVPLDTTTSPAVTTTQPGGDDVIEGMFDVGGHELYMLCEGTGSPTIIYLHGSIWDRGPDPHANARPIQDRMKETNRFCAYDRRNLAHSDTVDEVQDATHVMTDLRNLLDAAGVEPPYVLLGASFGGLLSYVYANSHPEEVVGMVLLDSGFPDEMSLEHLFAYEDTYEGMAQDDEESLERINHFAIQTAANEFIGSEPAIPVIYFASEQEPWNVNDYGIPEYDEQILDLQAAYVDRFSPGELVWVDSPHFMEPAIPQEIADALHRVIEMARP